MLVPGSLSSVNTFVSWPPSVSLMIFQSEKIFKQTLNEAKLKRNKQMHR